MNTTDYPTFGGVVLRSLWNFLMRFAKTIGCFCIVAGFVAAYYDYQQHIPMVDGMRYRESMLLHERLAKVVTLFDSTQKTVVQFKANPNSPETSEPKQLANSISQSYSDSAGLRVLRGQLVEVGSAKEALKASLVARFDSLVDDIQRKLLAHAASLKAASLPPAKPQQTPPIKPPDSDFESLFTAQLTNGELDSRKTSLDKAKDFLGVLQTSAENPENKKRLEDSIDEISTLAEIFPAFVEPPISSQPQRFDFEPSEPLNAEKVAYQLSQVRNSVRQAILSSWALDEAFDRALQTAEEELSKSLNAEAGIKRILEQLRLWMAISIAGGIVVGILFLLLGDWAQKRSIILIGDPWSVLIKNCGASTKEVYEIVENIVATRQIPGLEISRKFWHEGGALSAKREYLQFARERLIFEICAAPFGTGFFLSYRSSMIPLIVDPLATVLVLLTCGVLLTAFVAMFGLVWGSIVLVLSMALAVFTMRIAIARGLSDVDRVLMKTPLVAPLYELLLRPLTYYRIDTTAMYLGAIQDAVSEAFNRMFGDKDVALLPSTVPPPIMEAVYRRMIR